MKQDGLVPDGAVLSGARSSHDGNCQSRVQGSGHQEVLGLEEVSELGIDIGVAADGVQQSSDQIVSEGFNNWCKNTRF